MNTNTESDPIETCQSIKLGIDAQQKAKAKGSSNKRGHATFLDKPIDRSDFSACPPVEYENAVYHVMARGDRREPVVHDDGDRELFYDSKMGHATSGSTPNP